MFLVGSENCLHGVRRCPRIPDISSGLPSPPLLSSVPGIGTLVAISVLKFPNIGNEKRIGEGMKPVWLGIIFFLMYGMFSIKSHAAQDGLVAVAPGGAGDVPGWHWSCRGR
jgi:hypothetical protein